MDNPESDTTCETEKLCYHDKDAEYYEKNRERMVECGECGIVSSIFS